MEMLEPYDGKLSRTVRRGVWGGDAPDLPDRRGSLRNSAFVFCYKGIGWAGWCVRGASACLLQAGKRPEKHRAFGKNLVVGGRLFVPAIGCAIRFGQPL